MNPITRSEHMNFALENMEINMNHKRGKSKNQRAGCLMCKPNKMNGWSKHTTLGHTGFSKIKQWIHSEQDFKYDW